MHEITDLLAPNDPGKLHSAIERKAAGWAVMDADTRLSDSSTGARKGAKGDHKGAYSATIRCKHCAKGTCARGDKCRFSHKGSDKSSCKGGEGKKANNERDRCKKCGKIMNSPHWAKSCPEAVSGQVAMTPAPSSSSEATPPGLSVPVNNSANSESVAALAAVLRDVLSPVGSPDSGRAARLATLARSAGYVVQQTFPVFAARDQTKQLSMVVDSGAEVHLVCSAHKQFMKNLSKLDVPLQLETAGGDLTFDTIGDLFCGGIVCRGCVFNPLLTVSLFSTSRGDKDGYFYERCPEGYGVLKGPTGNVKLERSGGLDYLVGGEERFAFPALLTPGSVDGGYCRIDNVDIEHLRGGHLEFDPGCTTCTFMTMRGRQRRRQDDRETAGAGGEICADLTGRLPMAYNGSEYLPVALRRETRFGFVKALTNKRSETVKEAIVDMQLLLRGVWAFPQR